MKNFSVIVLVASIAFMAGAGLTYVSTRVSWVSDMADQPSIKPQEKPFPPPRNSIPTDLMGDAPARHFRPPSDAGQTEVEGHAHGPGEASRHHEHSSTSPAPEVKGMPIPERAHPHQHSGAQGADHHHDSTTSRGAGGAVSQTGQHTQEQSGQVAPHLHEAPAPMHRHDGESPSQPGDGHIHVPSSGSRSKAPLVNPIEPTAVSVSKGETLFNLHCQVCHGAEGQGGMPMATKITAIPKFTAAMLRSVSDDHMFSMVTAGHGPMPGYAEALTPEERWHVSNYVRSLQTRLANGKNQPASKGYSR